jgi:hypothetical protein
MTNGHRHNLQYPDEPIWSARLFWSTALLLAICAAVLVVSYFGPRSISPSFRATETPPALFGR